jgi:hypothetical protein
MNAPDIEALLSELHALDGSLSRFPCPEDAPLFVLDYLEHAWYDLDEVRQKVRRLRPEKNGRGR